MTDEQKLKKAERDRRYREKKKLAEAALAPKEPFTVSGMPEVPAPEPTPRPPFQPVKPQPAEIATAPSQLDRIEALLLELVETNRKLHPNISEALGGFKG